MSEENPIPAMAKRSRGPQVIATVPVDGSVGDIKANPRTNRVYFVCDDACVGVLDGRTNKLLSYAKTGDGPAYLAINPRTNRIYVTNFRDGTVSVISGRTNRLITTVKVGQRPFGIGVNPRTNRIYVANMSGSISVINGSTNRIRKTIAVGGSPALLKINVRTNRIYVTNTGTDCLTVIDGKTQTILATRKTGKNPVITPGVNPGTNRIYVASNSSRYLTVINGRTNRVMRRIPLKSLQSEVVVGARHNRIYVTSAQQQGPGKLFVIDGRSNRIMKILHVPTFASIFINPHTNHLFAGDTAGNRLYVFDGCTNKRIATLRTGRSAGNMALNPRTNRLFVGNSGSITVVRDWG